MIQDNYTFRATACEPVYAKQWPVSQFLISERPVNFISIFDISLHLGILSLKLSSLLVFK